MAPFKIPVASLKADTARYNWELGPDFFRLFDEEHEGERGRFHVEMNLERAGSIITLEFQIKGIVQTSCDRCLAPIDLPIEGYYELVVKFGDPGQTTDEVVFIDPEASGLNVGQHIYDFVLLSIPISRRIPGCESMDSPPCDMVVLNYLSKNENDPGSDSNDSPWEDLRKVTDN